MYKTKLAVALGASIAVAVAGMTGSTTALAGTAGTNSGTAATHASSVAAPAGVATPFTQYAQPLPVGAYLKHMCYLDMSDDFAAGGTLISPQAMVKQMYGSNKCTKIKVAVSPTNGYVGQVPVSGWATWGSPPDTETATPYVYYNGGGTTLNVTFSKKVQKAGLEIEPNPFATFTFSALYGGAGGANFTISAAVTSAKLLGAMATGSGTDKFTTIDVSGPVDFAVAQIRACLKKC